MCETGVEWVVDVKVKVVGVEAEEYREVSTVVDEACISVELILPSRGLHKTTCIHTPWELLFVCTNALSELVVYVCALGTGCRV